MDDDSCYSNPYPAQLENSFPEVDSSSDSEEGQMNYGYKLLEDGAPNHLSDEDDEEETSELDNISPSIIDSGPIGSIDATLSITGLLSRVALGSFNQSDLIAQSMAEFDKRYELEMSQLSPKTHRVQVNAGLEESAKLNELASKLSIDYHPSWADGEDQALMAALDRIGVGRTDLTHVPRQY